MGRALQLLACALTIIDARQLNQNASAADLLNVRLCHAQLVDTLADDAFGVVNCRGALGAENGEDFVFRGLRREQVLAFHVVEDAPQFNRILRCAVQLLPSGFKQLNVGQTLG